MSSRELDEDLAKFEQELLDLEKPSLSAPEPKRRKLIDDKETKPHPSIPQWQQALAERDYQLLQAKKAEQEEEGRVKHEAEKRAATKSGQWAWNEKKGEWFWQENPTLGASGKSTANTLGEVGVVQPGGAMEHDRVIRGKEKVVRTAAGKVWTDPTMDVWPENDFRIFVGDLGGDTTDEVLRSAFEKYPSFNMSRVVLDSRTKKCKGFGFVSFGKGEDMLRAMKEMNGKYVGSRPCKLRKSNWKDRAMTSERQKDLALLKRYTKSFK